MANVGNLTGNLDLPPNVLLSATVIALLPGQKCKLRTSGFFVRKTSIKDSNDNDVLLNNGFRVLDENVGTVEPIAGKPEVYYTHKKPERNVILFYASTGEVGACIVDAIQIHDHSSIVQGGPAYGTYFNDESEGEEE